MRPGTTEEEKRKAANQKAEQEKKLLLQMVLANESVNKNEETKKKVQTFNKNQLLTLACIFRGLKEEAQGRNEEKLLEDALKARPKEEKRHAEPLDEKEPDPASDPTARLVNFLNLIAKGGEGASQQLNQKLREWEANGAPSVQRDLQKQLAQQQSASSSSQRPLPQQLQQAQGRTSVSPRPVPGARGKTEDEKQAQQKSGNYQSPTPLSTTPKRH